MDVLRDDPMSFEQGEGVRATEALLREAGFDVSEPCRSRPSCFDLAARKNENLVLIKVQSDIDSFSLGDSVELKGISSSVFANPILVSKMTREKPLEDDTVYSRHGVSAISVRTFESIVVGKTRPLIQAGPGGYYVEVNGRAVRRRRQKLGLSVGEMAEKIGISRRTLYGYERGMTKASVAAAYNLVFILGIPVAKSVNVLERPRTQHTCCLLATAKRMIAKNKLLTRIFMKNDRYSLATVKKAPFDFVITIPKERMKIIGGVAGSKERRLDERVDEILSVSKVVQAHPVLITEGQRLPDKNISCICREELSRIKSPEELIGSVT